jgi:RNA 2',3'-cyclic 3'-phosphodiesterase
VTSRLFVAVVPPLEVLEHLQEFTEPRQDRSDPLHWSDPARWHLTVAFMPAAPDPRYDDLVERLEEQTARRSLFELAIGGAGTFPNPAEAKVLWAGVTGDLESLTRLSTGVRTAANTSGVAAEGGQFHPHLTLARTHRPLDVTRWLRVFDGYRGPSWSVTEVQLIQSHLGRSKGHAAHEVREIFELGGRPS